MTIPSRGLVWSLLASLAAAAATAQQAAPPDSIPSRIAAIFAPYARTNAPGCAVGAFRAGAVLYSGGFGMTDVAHHLPLTDTTAIPVASLSKQFTAFTVLLLEAEGKLALDDDVRRYVPELPMFGPPITIRNLLNHTSGLRDTWNLFDMAGWRITEEETASDMLWLIQRQRALNHLPGAEFRYNSTGFFLLSLLAERVSGVPFQRLVSERVFGPLGMTRSVVKADMDQVVDGLATGYWGHDPAGLLVARPPFSWTGATGVVTTVRDLARWDANYYRTTVGTVALRDAMAAPGRLTDGTAIGHGLGQYLGRYRGRRMLSHAGSDPGYRSEFIRFPEDSLTVTVLCNAFDIAPTPLALRVADLYLAGGDSVATVAGAHARSPAIAPKTLAGLYWHAATGNAYTFYFENDQLLLDGGGEGKFPLAPLGDNSYRLTAAPRRYVLTFRQGPGARLAVEENIEGSPPRTFERVPEAARSGSPLLSLAGAYYSPELEVTWTFVVGGRKLALQRHRMQPDSLDHLFGNVFQSRHGFLLEFSPGRNGRAAAVDVSTERVRRLRFTRRP
jgi:CubicO group peptidase (beta-lactamase class C family)